MIRSVVLILSISKDPGNSPDCILGERHSGERRGERDGSCP